MRGAVLAAAVLGALAVPGTAVGETPHCAQGNRLPVVEACFEAPVARYGHNVLGETPEWSVLRVGTVHHPGARAGMTGETSTRVPPGRIFEDVAPRIADLDGDGRDEILVIEADRSAGARLVVYELVSEAEQGLGTGTSFGVKVQAATPFIGRSFRWRAPVAIADLDGDGRVEIAEVVTPHLAGVLRVWRLEGPRLVEVAEPLRGVSNHRIGDAFMTGAITPCAPVRIVLPDLDWQGLVAVGLSDGRLSRERVEGVPTAEGAAVAAEALCAR